MTEFCEQCGEFDECRCSRNCAACGTTVRLAAELVWGNNDRDDTFCPECAERLYKELRDSTGWFEVDDSCEFETLYWLSDGTNTWIGSRVWAGEAWAWTEAERYWWDAHHKCWDGDTEMCDMNPTHFMELPRPPVVSSEEQR